MHQNYDMPIYPPSQPHVNDSLVQVIAVKLENLHNDVSTMQDVLKELAAAVTKLAVIEERQGQAAQALERAFIALEKLEVRMSVLEKAQPLQQQTTDWVGKAVWGTVIFAAGVVAKKLGFL